MSRLMDWFNLAGVAALAILCSLQWRTNAGLSASLIRLEQTRQAQAATIADDATKLKSVTADLDDAHARLTLAESELAALQKELITAVAEQDALAKDRDQLKACLTLWQEAVAARDAALKTANELIGKVAAERNEAIVKFNALAADYNGLVAKVDKAK